MFSKPAKTTEGADHHAPRKPMPASLIGEGMAIKGDLNATGDLHLDGAVEGDIAVERGNFRFYFPLVTSLVVSLVLTLLFWLFRR